MPSPLGHALGAVAAGCLIAARRRGRTPEAAARRGVGRESTPFDGLRTLSPRLLIFAASGVLPDADFLLGWHSRYTHSIGAALAVVVIARYASRVASWRMAVAIGAAYSSHVILDWLGTDTTPPIGIMALWPVTTDYYQSDLYWFPAIWRTYQAGFWVHNIAAAVWETLVLGPIAAAAWWWTQSGPTEDGRGDQAYP